MWYQLVSNMNGISVSFSASYTTSGKQAEKILGALDKNTT